MLNLFGIDWVMPIRVRDLLVSWGDQVGRVHIMEAWRLAQLRLMWCLWRKWNA
jgi:hypothetical protein